MLTQKDVRHFMRQHYHANPTGFRRSSCWLALRAHANEQGELKPDEVNELRRFFYEEAPTPFSGLKSIANSCRRDGASFQETLCILERELDLIENEGSFWLTKLYPKQSETKSDTPLSPGELFIAKLHELKQNSKLSRKQVWQQLADQFKVMSERDRLALFIYHWRFSESELDDRIAHFQGQHRFGKQLNRLELHKLLSEEMLIINDDKESNAFNAIFCRCLPLPEHVLRYLEDELTEAPYRSAAIKTEAERRFANDCFPGEIYYHWKRLKEELEQAVQSA